MTNFDYVQKTIDLFEDSLLSGSPFTKTENLAARIGYCSRHLGRLFQSLCGEPLGRYMQKRRLAEAVSRIISKETSAAQAAASLGWEDYSSFSRAVKKEFGVTPGNLREISPEKISLATRARPKLQDNPGLEDLNPVLLQTDRINITGLVFYMGPNEKSFHRPWNIYCRLQDRIRGRTGQGTYQFSSWTEGQSGPDEGLWIHCATETEKGIQQEPFFFSRIIPDVRILRFTHTGPVEHLHETYRIIWEDYLPKSTFHLSGNWEYQYYPDPSDPCLIEICLPVL